MTPDDLDRLDRLAAQLRVEAGWCGEDVTGYWEIGSVDVGLAMAKPAAAHALDALAIESSVAEVRRLAARVEELEDERAELKRECRDWAGRARRAERRIRDEADPETGQFLGNRGG